MKKLLIVVGSPRKNGNSDFLAQAAAKTAREEGAEVEFVQMSTLATVKPCKACDCCMKSRDSGCVIQDDLTPVLESARAADGIIIAGPVYWFSFTAQIKLFIDRAFYSMCDPAGPHLLAGKKLGMIIPFGDKNPFVSGAINALRSFQDITAFMGAELCGLVYGTANAPGEAAANADLVREAEELGAKIARKL